MNNDRFFFFFFFFIKMRPALLLNIPIHYFESS